MGCSSSRDARGGKGTPAAPAPAERRQPALASVGLCRGRNGEVQAYSPLPVEMLKRRTPPPCSKRGLMVVLEDAASAASSTGRWPPSSTSGTLQWSSLLSAQSASDYDPGIVSGFRQTLAAPSPSHPALLFPERAAPEEPSGGGSTSAPAAARAITEFTGLVRARVAELEQKKKQRAEAGSASASAAADVAGGVALPPQPARAGSSKAVVVYYTSLRGVRKTFEDYRAVHTILGCYRVRVDERDVSMDGGFKAELRGLLGPDFAGPMLPRVFVGGERDLGTADDVRALHESGELARLLAGCEAAAAAAGGVLVCAACGDTRFLVCETCNGSCKIFPSDARGRLATNFEDCPDCNENGLVRCPVCFY